MSEEFAAFPEYGAERNVACVLMTAAATRQSILLPWSDADQKIRRLKPGPFDLGARSEARPPPLAAPFTCRAGKPASIHASG
jgi:hypothetical protein